MRERVRKMQIQSSERSQRPGLGDGLSILPPALCPGSLTHPFIIQQIFIECLLCARSCASSGPNKQSLPSWSQHALGRRLAINKTHEKMI